MTIRESIIRCKTALPLPALWRALAMPGEPRKTCFSPFRENKNTEAFSVFEREGLWFWRDHGLNIGGDEIDFLMQLGLEKPAAIKRYHELAGIEYPERELKPQSKFRAWGKLIRTHDYFNADGRLVHQSLKYEHRWAQRRPAAEGMHQGRAEAKRDRVTGQWWLWTLEGIEPVLYRLPQLLKFPASPVVLCEGEKDADALSKVEPGAVTTSVPMGAGKWRPSYAETLAGRDIIIAYDRDSASSMHAGQRGAATIAAILRPIAKRVRIVNWAALWPSGAAEPERKLDIAEFIAATAAIAAGVA